MGDELHKNTLGLERPDVRLVEVVGSEADETRISHFYKWERFNLNTKHKIVAVHEISRGTLNNSMVHPREVFKPAVLHNAAAIICFHNHPSGDPNPSQDDVAMNSRLVEAGKIMGIEILDHIIIGDDEYVSLKERGVM